MEYLAKFIYPEQFTSLKPEETYNQIIKTYTTIPIADALWGSQAAQ